MTNRPTDPPTGQHRPGSMAEEFARLEQLYRTAPVGLCLHDRDLRYVFINERLAEINGRPVEEHIGRTLREVLHDVADRIEPDLLEVIETGEPIIEQEVITATPSEPQVEMRYLVSYHPFRDEAGRIVGVTALVQEFTELLRAQRRVEESEARYRSLVEHAPDAIVVIDVETGKFVDFNQNALDLLGLDRDSILEVGPTDVSPRVQPDGRLSEEYSTENRAAAIEGQQLTFKWTHRHADGHMIPCEVRLVRLPARDRVLLRGSIIDISERVKVERALLESEEKYRVVVKTATDAIITISQDSTIQMVNPATEEVFGYRPDELIGRPLADLIPESLRARHKKGFGRFVATGKRTLGWNGIELSGLRKNGEVFPIEISLGAMRRENGGYHFTGYLRDITERKRAEMLKAGQRRVLERLAQGEALPEVLAELTRTIDRQQAGLRSSVLLLDEEGKRLRHIAGPQLPRAYAKAIDGLVIGPRSGACGTASFLGKRVIVSDIATDPLCADVRDLALRYNLRSCWSQPIFAQSGKALGTFAIYHDRPAQPSPAEIELIEQAANIAGVAIERQRSIEALRASEAALRRSHADLQDLAGRLINAQEEERRRLARDLPDDLTQRLAVLAIEVGKLEASRSAQPPQLRDGLRRIKDEMVRLSEEVHDMSRELHPALLEDLGLVDAIASECARFSDHEGIRATFRSGRVPASIPRKISLCLYRVLQEALRNIAKHSGATKAQIALKGQNGSIILSIRDDGAGFDPTRSRQAGGVGLASLQERVRLVNGSVGIRSRMGQGTTIEVRTPLPDRTPKTKATRRHPGSHAPRATGRRAAAARSSPPSAKRRSSTSRKS